MADEISTGNAPEQKIRFSIRAKMLVLFLILFTALGAITWQGYDLFVTDKENYVAALDLQVALELSKQTAERIEFLDKQARAFADLLDYDFGGAGAKRAALRRGFADMDKLLYIAVGAPGSRNPDIFSNRALLEKADLTQEAIKEQLREAGLADTTEAGKRVLVNSTRGLQAPTIRYAARHETGAGGQVLIVAEFLRDRLLAGGADEEVYTAYIVDGTGAVLAHPDDAVMASKLDFSGIEAVKALHESTYPGSRECAGEDGRVMLGAFAQVDESGTGVIVQIPKEEALAASTLLLKRSLFIVLAVSIIAALLILGFARSLTKPVSALSKAAQQVARGEFDIELNVTSWDEIGALARTFSYMTTGLKERDRVKQTFARYVSPQVATKILSVEDELTLQGEKREVAILFSDIRGFTAMSEQRSAGEVVEILNEYFTRMVSLVFKYEGTLDKYIGDAILAVFGAPLEVEDKEMSAVKTAVEMQQELTKMNAEMAARGWPELKIGIGVNTGEVVAGNIGSPQRLEYTIIGDNVNTAQRIEAATKAFGGGVLISQSTYDAVRDRINADRLDPIVVSGKAEAMQLYRIV